VTSQVKKGLNDYHWITKELKTMVITKKSSHIGINMI